MKYCTFREISCLLALAFVVVVSSCAEATSPIRLAVINAARDVELRQPSEIAANTFTGTLAKSSAVMLAEREELDVVIREQEISASELEGAAARIGRLMGCEYVLLVSLVYKDSPVVSAKLVDVSTSEIVYSDTEIPDYEDDSAMGAASSRMADKLLEVLAGEQAVITEIRDNEVVINRGSSSGVRAGDLYRVYMGTKRIQANFGVIRVKDVQAGFSHAELVKNGGYIDLIRNSDKVEAVSKTEAEALIKRKKFARYRPGERDYEDASLVVLKKAASPMNEYSDYLNNVVAQSADKLGKRANDVMERYSSGGNVTNDELYLLARDMLDLAEALSRDLSYGVPRKVRARFEAMYADQSDEWPKDVVTKLREYDRQMTDVVNTGYSAAVDIFEELVKSGHVYAINSLGIMYHDGKGVSQDYARAA